MSKSIFAVSSHYFFPERLSVGISSLNVQNRCCVNIFPKTVSVNTVMSFLVPSRTKTFVPIVSTALGAVKLPSCSEGVDLVPNMKRRVASSSY